MKTNLIKLLVNIEESAQQFPLSPQTPLSQRKSWQSKDTPSLFQKSSFQSKEKKQRRALRSKITKILQALPHHCEKQQQKSYSSKWAEHKKRFYEINKQRKLLGKDPLSKLNLSSDSSNCEAGHYSAREVLLRNLNKNELFLLNEDPFYFIPDKKLFKAEEDYDWDLLLKEDPKDPENQNRGEKRRESNINFLKEPEKSEAKPKKKIPEFRKSQPVLMKSSQSSKFSIRAPPFRIEIGNRVKKQIESVRSLPLLEKNSLKKTEIRPRHEKLVNDTKEFEQFLKASSEFELRLKHSIIKHATDSKLTGVKLLLTKWETKKRVSL